MTPPGDHPPKRRLTQPPLVTDDPGDREPTNDDLRPLGASRIDYIRAAKVLGKAIAALVVAVAVAVPAAWGYLKPVIIEYREISAREAKISFKTIRDAFEAEVAARIALEKRTAILEAEKAAPKKGGAHLVRKSPAPVAAAPKALPRDLDEAVRQAGAHPPAAARPTDAGQQ